MSNTCYLLEDTVSLKMCNFRSILHTKYQINIFCLSITGACNEDINYFLVADSIRDYSCDHFCGSRERHKPFFQ